MLCFKARKRLIKYNWDKTIFGKDAELMKHLQKCRKCQNLILAEKSLVNNLSGLKQTISPQGLAFEVFQQKLEMPKKQSSLKNRQSVHTAYILKGLLRPKYIFGFAVALLLALAIIPFNVTETVGYEISISGIDRNIALNNQEVPSLLDALGMEPNKVSSLLNSMEKKEIYLYVGNCEETCDLKISDLKTERDAHLVIKAIIELGCCEIEKVIPIIKNHSTNLIKQTAKQLFS